MRLFLVAAIVFIVFALIAAAQASADLFGVAWPVWLCAGLLAWILDQVWAWGFPLVSDRRGPPQQ